MALELDAIGTTSEPVERSWRSKEALLYAVAVGAGAADPTDELAFTTENSQEVSQQVLPTFAVVVGAGGRQVLNIGSFNPAMLVHAEQALELHRPLDPEGTVRITSRLVDILDKRSGALVVLESRAVDPDTGEDVFTTRSGLFIRGEGGFAGDSNRRSAPAPSLPERPPDRVISYPTLPQQALLYRLCGDRNPLHSDPAFAAMAGFDRPILHGLCTYGFTGRALLHGLCGSDPARFRSMFGRFTSPVLPGQTLTISVWIDDPTDGDTQGGDTPAGASFQTTTEDGTVVLDRGRCTFQAPAVAPVAAEHREGSGAR